MQSIKRLSKKFGRQSLNEVKVRGCVATCAVAMVHGAVQCVLRACVAVDTCTVLSFGTAILILEDTKTPYHYDNPINCCISCGC